MRDDQRRTILCVDDEQDIVDSLFDTFMDKYNVKTATSAQDALSIFDKEDIAVIITDQRMPAMQGTELLSKINEIKPICKKILLTGYSDINAAIDAINLGKVDRYITKPWDDEDLIGAVDSLISVYKVDEVFQRIISDGKNMKNRLDSFKKSSDLFLEFLNSHKDGIAIIHHDEIDYINQKGIEILQYDSFEELGPNINYGVIFKIDTAILNNMKENYKDGNGQLTLLQARLKSGKTISIKAAANFISELNELTIRGIIFSTIDDD